MAKAIFEINSIYKKWTKKKKKKKQPTQHKILQSIVGWIEYLIKWRLIVCGSKAEVTISGQPWCLSKVPKIIWSS